MFSEGWIEFKDKKVAKKVALTLNTQIIGGKRRNPWYEEMWTMKYLSKFQWAHLNERLAYERQVHKQRLRNETAQAKKETDFYVQNVEKRNFLEKKAKKSSSEIPGRSWTFEQTKTEEQFVEKKRKSEEEDNSTKPAKKQKTAKKAGEDTSFLQSLFSGGITS